MRTHAFLVTIANLTTKTWATDSDTAVELVLKHEGAPHSALESVYQEDPVPHADARYGAPMGRMSGNLDFDGKWKADPVDLDEGYDPGGAYWGMRPSGQTLFAVQDGMGNIAFVDAANPQSALEQAAA